MQQDSEKPRKAFPWGTPVSILVHLAIAAVFLVNLPAKQPTPDQEQAVNVELVPPAEEKKPEEKKPEQAKQEEKKPEEKPPEKPPEPPKEVAKAEEPPPPPPPPPKEEAKEQPKPEPPKEKEDPKTEEPPKEEVKASVPTGRPVQEFGDKDTGPELSDTGDSPVADAGSDTAQGDKQLATDPKVDIDPPIPLQKPPSASPLPKGINLPQVDTAAIQAGKDGPAILGTDEAKTSFEAEKTPEQTKSAEGGSARAQPGDLKRAKILFSQKATGGKRAQVAMGTLSRGERFGQLCWTELKAQLQHAGYANDQIILPIFLGPDGSNILEVKYGAFRNSYGWYHQNFRCEVNQEATKVVSFAFAVGSPVDRSEWKSLRITFE